MDLQPAPPLAADHAPRSPRSKFFLPSAAHILMRSFLGSYMGLLVGLVSPRKSKTRVRAVPPGLVAMWPAAVSKQQARACGRAWGARLGASLSPEGYLRRVSFASDLEFPLAVVKKRFVHLLLLPVVFRQPCLRGQGRAEARRCECREPCMLQVSLPMPCAMEPIQNSKFERDSQPTSRGARVVGHVSSCARTRPSWGSTDCCGRWQRAEPRHAHMRSVGATRAPCTYASPTAPPSV